MLANQLLLSLLEQSYSFNLCACMHAQVNELRRIVEKYHLQHKLLKSKVTELARRIRAIEPWVNCTEREEFLILMEELSELVGKED